LGLFLLSLCVYPVGRVIVYLEGKLRRCVDKASEESLSLKNGKIKEKKLFDSKYLIKGSLKTGFWIKTTQVTPVGVTRE